MNSKQLSEAYISKKDSFHRYVYDIKKTAKVDIYSIINATIIKNPYVSEFPKNFFLGKNNKKNLFLLFLRISGVFYIRQYYSLFTYFISFLLFIILYKKDKLKHKNSIFIDVFFLVDNIIKKREFDENYFIGLYEVLDKKNIKYTFLPRLYGTSKNPFKLISLFKILNKDSRSFLFEFELILFKDFFVLFFMIFLYPFKTLRLLQKENSRIDLLFNTELIKDISSIGFESFSRYIFGKNIAKLDKTINKIYSWSEFQAVERSFNYGIRNNTTNIKLYGCQFYLKYETYFNIYIDDIDFKNKTSFHEVLVNGKFYIENKKLVTYKEGVSLRYADLFKYEVVDSGDNILLLGSYIEQDTKYMLDNVSAFKNILFKNHPILDIKKLGKMHSNIIVVEENIYELFKTCNIVIGTASGTLVEAVACGLSVIVIASQSNLTGNPLINYGKGKVWDIAFSKDEVDKLYHKLVNYREKNIDELEKISVWYRKNFFIEPTEENIIKAFELERD